MEEPVNHRREGDPVLDDIGVSHSDRQDMRGLCLSLAAAVDELQPSHGVTTWA